jgi:hypothetical protein
MSLASMSAPAVGIATTPSGAGYWFVGSDGGIFSFGNAKFYGSIPGLPISAQPGVPVVGMAATPSGLGYWEVTADGGVYSFGDAKFYGSIPGLAASAQPNSPVVEMLPTPSGQGYWEVTADGGVYSFGDAKFYGSLPGLPASAQPGSPVVALTATPSGQGYWEVTAGGDVYSFGDAQFYGSMGGVSLNKPVVGMAAGPGGAGYWLVASDGGIFAFGDAQFYGSMGGVALDGPVVGIAAGPGGAGYWLVASDGGIFSFGDAHFYGSMGGSYISNTPHGLGILPPANPPYNINPVPDFISAGPNGCVSTGGGPWVCQNPCFSIVGNTTSYSNTSPACTDYQLAAINYARGVEGVSPMVLPTNWYTLTVPEQLFVLADLERTDRGLPPYLGMVPVLDQAANTAAIAFSDPTVPAGFALANYNASGGAWSSGPTNAPLTADYGWMYQDGWGGSAANTSNLACYGPTSSGCWAHRDELLGLSTYDSPTPWGVGLYCHTCVMGTGYFGSPSEGGSYVDLVVKPAGAVPAMDFTWATNVLPYLPGG